MNLSPILGLSDYDWICYKDLKENKIEYVKAIKATTGSLKKEILVEEENEKKYKTTKAKENAARRKKHAQERLETAENEIRHILSDYDDLDRKVGMATFSYMNSQYDSALSTIARNKSHESNPYAVGGFVNGIAGPAAGLYAAYRTDQTNRSLQQTAVQLENQSKHGIHDTFDHSFSVSQIISRIDIFLDTRCELRELRKTRQQQIKERLEFNGLAREKNKAEIEQYNKKWNTFFKLAFGVVIIYTFIACAFAKTSPALSVIITIISTIKIIVILCYYHFDRPQDPDKH